MGERRHLQRHLVSVPVTLEHGTGLTRDLSADGVYFETLAEVAAGERLRFAIELAALSASGLTACCEAEVIRTEPREQLVGVAARITSIDFDSFPHWLSLRESAGELSH